MPGDEQYEKPTVVRLGSIQELTADPTVKNVPGADHFSHLPSATL